MPDISLTRSVNPYAVDSQAIERQRMLAQMLQQQAIKPIQDNVSHGPMGSVTAPTSWTEGLAKLMQGYVGGKSQENLDQRQLALANRIREEAGQQMSAMPQGTPAIPENAPQSVNGEPAVGPTMPSQPEQGPDRGKMQAWASMLQSSGNPMTAQLGTKMLEKYLTPVSADTLAKEQGLDRRFGGVSGNTAATIANANALKDRPDPNKPFNPDGTPNANYQSYSKELKAIGAPKTTVTVDNKAESKYATEIGGKAADRDAKQYDAATAAVENATKLDGVLNELKTSKAITGMGSDILKNIERAKVLLASDKAAGKKVSDTEYLDAVLGSDVFPYIQALGIGARGMDTPAERDYIRSVMTGTVSMNKQTLIKMTEIRRNIAQRAMDNWNKRVTSGEVDDFFKYSKIPKKTIDYAPQQSSQLSQQGGGWSIKPIP